MIRKILLICTVPLLTVQAMVISPRNPYQHKLKDSGKEKWTPEEIDEHASHGTEDKI